MAEFVHKEITRRPAVLRRFRNTRCADEIVLQTLLLNSRFRDRVENTPLCFVDWQTGPEYPRTFTLDDFPRLLESGAYFARKFDSTKDPGVIRQVLQNV